jgi:6-pyruvoyltetrahydropterin/6-carboxytetrahydropterin synthase
MYTLFVDTTFTAQHQLSFANGIKEPLHEHDWKVCVAVSSDQLNKDELVIDFEKLKSLLKKILREYNGKQLETLKIFENQNVSAETLARTLYEQLSTKLSPAVQLDFIEVTEAPGCRARYSP